MSFADDVAAVAAKPKGPRCTAGLAAEKLSPEDRDGFERCLLAVLAKEYTYEQVRTVLAARDLDVPEHTLSRHARRKCLCPPWEQAA